MPSDASDRSLDLDFVHRQFPALSEHHPEWALMDNAGGSVVPRQVHRRISDYLERHMMQLGASYPLSQSAGAQVQLGHRAAERLVGAAEGEVVLGPSTTVNAALLSRALRPLWSEGDVVIVSELDHEANIGPWVRLAQTGVEVQIWKLRPDTADLALDDLEAMIAAIATRATGALRLVAMTHCANVVGRIHDIPAVAERVHAAGAQLCVDGVAYAPHRLVDVSSLGADYYLLSLYKVYGPHQGLMWGRRELLEAARGQNHHFIDEAQVPYKFEPGNVTHELSAGLPGILDYLGAVDVHHQGAGEAEGADALPSRAALARTFARFAAHEAALAEALLDFLRAHPKVRVVGPETSDAELRVPTIAFTVEGRKASELPPLFDARKIAIRWGHFYAERAIRALGLEARDGIVRVSMVHYNTLAEVERLTAALDELL